MKRHMTEEQKELLRQKAKEARRLRKEQAAARLQESATNQVPQMQQTEIIEEVIVVEEAAERPVKQQSRAIQARWAGEQAAEEDLRQHFLTIPLEKAFFLYEKMRKNLETAGRILNDRANVPEIQKCKTCGKTYEQIVKEGHRRNGWFLDRPYYKEGDRNVILVSHFCSAACVSLENNQTQGVYGMSDRGMTPDMNKKNHPREFPGQKGA